MSRSTPTEPPDPAPTPARADSSLSVAPKPLNWRRTLYALWIAQTLAIVAFSLRAPFLPFYLADLGMESTEQRAFWSGLIIAGGALVMAVTAPLWGIVSDRFGRRPMVLRSMFAAMVAATVPRDRVGFSLGLIQTAVFSGSSLGPLFGGVLADQIGYRATFAVASAMMAAAGLIVLFLVEERFSPAPRTARTGRWGAATWALMSGKVMLTMVLAMFVIRGTSMAIQPILPLLVETLPHGGMNDATLAGLIMGMAGLTSAMSSIYFGRLGDRIGHQRILLGCAVGAGLLYLPMAIANHAWQLLLIQACFGVAAGGLIPTANAMVTYATAPERRGVVFGLMAGAGSLGAFVGPLSAGALVATAGFAPTFALAGLVLLLTAAAMFVSFWTTPDSRQPTAVSRQL